MKLTKQFKTDLMDCYYGEITLDQLIIRNKNTIKNFSDYYYRKHKSYLRLNNDDDLYQITCLELSKHIWKWDETRNVSLSRYISHNLEVYLKAEIQKERAIKRGYKAKIEDVNERIK